MRKLLFFVSMFLVVIHWMGCTKCYTCQNTCTKCIYTGGNFALAQIVCRDSFASEEDYDTAIANSMAFGYVCSPTSPTYTENFCVNKPGEGSYPDYYDKGGRVTCVPK